MEIEILNKNRAWFLTVGILYILLGTAAIIFPFVATLALEIMLGWILIIGGIVSVFHSFVSGKWGKFFLQFLGGLLYLAVGLLLLANPLKGVLTLTLLLIAYLLADGIFRIIWSFQMRPLKAWGWILFSGILSLLLALLLWQGWPSTAVWAIGLLVGINILFGGWTMVMLAGTAKKAAP